MFYSYEKKIPDRSNVKKKGLISVHSLGVHPIMVVKSWWQKRVIILSSTRIRKQIEMNAGAL